jgi:hypothetical protein
MDVKTTFLNGELDKEIYIERSDGFFARRLGKKGFMASNKLPSNGMRSLKELEPIRALL